MGTPFFTDSTIFSLRSNEYALIYPLDGVGAQLLFNIGVALILFHGGVGISLRVISRTAVGLGLLVLPGVAITALIVAVVISPLFGVSLLVAFMIGAVLAATDPAIIIPSSRGSVCARRCLKQ